MTSQVRVSYCMIPAGGGVRRLIDAAATADQLGLHAVYQVDEIWHRDPYLLAAVIAQRTSRIRVGFNVTHLLRHPALIAQSLATLDDLSGGRAEAAVSTGSLDMLAQFGVTPDQPVRRLREAHTVIRQLLDDGKTDFAGKFYNLPGVYTTIRPVQSHLPVMLGGMRGPLSFRLAGEVADGLCHAGGYGLEALQYVAAEFRAAAGAAGRDWQALDLGAWIGGVISDDREAALSAARFMTAFYLPATPPEQLIRHGISPEEVQPVIDLVNSGDVAGAARLLPPRTAAALSVAGTPEEAAEQIAATFLRAGFNHLVFGLVDGIAIKALTGTDPGGLPPLDEQLTLIAQRLIPRITG